MKRLNTKLPSVFVECILHFEDGLNTLVKMGRNTLFDK